MTNPWNNRFMVFFNLMSIEMVSIFSSLNKSFKRLLIFLPLIIGLLLNPISANALYPSDPSSVDVLKDDLHGADLQNTEYVKYDLSNQDLGEANLQGAYMSVTTAKNSSFKGANMKDLIAYATRFDNADLLVHESTFSKQDEKMAYEKLHSTTIMAAKPLCYLIQKN